MILLACYIIFYYTFSGYPALQDAFFSNVNYCFYYFPGYIRTLLPFESVYFFPAFCYFLCILILHIFNAIKCCFFYSQHLCVYFTHIFLSFFISSPLFFVWDNFLSIWTTSFGIYFCVHFLATNLILCFCLSKCPYLALIFEWYISWYKLLGCQL